MANVNVNINIEVTQQMLMAAPAFREAALSLLRGETPAEGLTINFSGPSLDDQDFRSQVAQAVKDGIL